MPEMILPTRVALRRKPVDPEDNVDESLRIRREWFHPDGNSGEEHKAKCRWIIVGFHDPDILELEVSAPAPQLQTVNRFLSVSALASMPRRGLWRWDGRWLRCRHRRWLQSRQG